MFIRIKQIINRARNHAGFRRYAANTSWMFAEQMMRMVAGLLVGIWVARYLGPDQFGVFSYTVAFSALFSSIAKLGLDSIIVRDLVRDPSQRDLYMGTAFWLKLMGAGAMLAIIAFVVQLISNDSTTNLYIFIIASGTIFQSFEVVDFYFQSQVLYKLTSICKLIQLTISSLLKIYLIYKNEELIYFCYITLFDQATYAISLYVAYRCNNFKNFFNFFNATLAKKILLDSWPLVFSGLVVMLYMRIDQVMIKEILGDKEAGLYSAAVKISEVWYFIPMILTNSLFPSIINAKKINETIYHERLQKLYVFLVWIGLFIALPITFFSNWIIIFLYGMAYTDASQVLTIHIWTGIFVSLGVASSSWYANENMQKQALYRTSLGAFVNILANLILIPKFGLVGAALATLIAQSVAALFYDCLTKKTRIVFFMKLKTLNFFILLSKE